MPKPLPRLFIIPALLLALIIIVYANYSHIRPVLVQLKRDTIRWVAIVKDGKSGYIAKVKQQQADPAVPAEEKLLETEYLPLRMTVTPLNKGDVRFAAEAGAIGKIGNSLVLLDRLGNLYKYQDGELSKLNIKEIPNNLNDYILHAGAQLGGNNLRAHSIAYDDSTHRLYLGYTKFIGKNTNQFAVDSIDIDDSKAGIESTGDWKNEFLSDPVSSNVGSQGGGGKIYILKRNLYISVGYSDAGDDGSEGMLTEAQNPKSTFGKIFEFNLDTHEATVFAVGFRNAQGLTSDDQGILYGVDQGPQGGDEINLLQRGKNYGWPYISYGVDYGKYTRDNGYKGSTPLDASQFTPPLFAFIPSVATSTISYLGEGVFAKEWKNSLLIGSLKGQTLYRAALSDGHVLYVESMWIGHRIRDIHVDSDVIYLLTDDTTLVSLSVDVNALQKNVRNNGLFWDVEVKTCLRCHSFAPSNPTSTAPSLLHVYGRAIASDAFVNYSSALRSKGGSWNDENLSSFLRNPNSFAPGTQMPNLNLSDSDIKGIVKVLKRNK
jgi:glucose/arabinose dehydrogenase